MDNLMFISHRGNLTGRIPDQENRPSYIREALDAGYYVEVDVWWFNGIFYLGHDEPTYQADYLLLTNPKVICHAKNIDALYRMTMLGNIHCFYHDDHSPVALTSKGYLWTAPNVFVTPRSIVCANDPWIFNYKSRIAGVYSDNIAVIKQNAFSDRSYFSKE